MRTIQWVGGALAIAVAFTLSYCRLESRGDRPAAATVELSQRPAGTAVPTAAPPDRAPDSSPAAQAPASRPKAPASSQPPLATGPSVGSEGYGPVVQRALDLRDAKLALAAMRLVQDCGLNRTLQVGMERFRQDAKFPQDTLKTVLEGLQAEERRCQTLTPALADPVALGEIAMDGGARGAAAAYYRISGGVIAPSLSERMTAGLQTDALDGDANSVAVLLLQGRRSGLPEVQMRAYERAAERMDLPVPQDVLKLEALVGRSQPLGAQDEKRARDMAQRIVDAWRSGGS